MATGYVIAGTDTGVGKTFIACALLHRLREAGVTAVGMKPVAAGAAAGLVGAMAVTTLMQSLLFGVDPIDPATYVAATAALAAIALAACAVPARRATRVDPLVALRDE